MKNLLVAAATLGALIPAAASAEIAQVISGTRLDISARGEVTRVPDVAVISAGVLTQAKDAQTALADNATQMTRVLAALKRAGVADRDVSTSSIGLSAQYLYAENKPPVVTGYQANNSVTIKFRDVAKSGTILDALVAAGANQINGPNLMIDKPAPALNEARVQAMALARSRAELYAKAAGLTVKRIVSIGESADEQGPRPYPMMMMARDGASAKTQITPGEQQIGVTLTVTFELN
ncbi:SIMPL domain-containing protein [Sphingomonas sp.]|uniref:SIMPL domain-containing protein n=1 Tax=Sphingomonas sp. TaxID=28214 RepID=UPI0025E14E56|nr:SIMPL domain-containing protein [Sphingomonas sp.]